MDVDPLEPYGSLIETSLRIVTWNVRARYGPWRERTRTIASVPGGLAPDHRAFAAAEREFGARGPIPRADLRQLVGFVRETDHDELRY